MKKNFSFWEEKVYGEDEENLLMGDAGSFLDWEGPEDERLEDAELVEEIKGIEESGIGSNPCTIVSYKPNEFWLFTFYEDPEWAEKYEKGEISKEKREEFIINILEKYRKKAEEELADAEEVALKSGVLAFMWPWTEVKNSDLTKKLIEDLSKTNSAKKVEIGEYEILLIGGLKNKSFKAACFLVADSEEDNEMGLFERISLLKIS